MAGQSRKKVCIWQYHLGEVRSPFWVTYSLLNSTFPDRMKVAQVVPLHKKNSTLEKGNYRPVSVLPVLSKIFERAIHCQLVEFLTTILMTTYQLLDQDMDVKLFY